MSALTAPPRDLTYLRPTSVAEAVDMAAEHDAGARFWAGGTDLMLEWNRRIRPIHTCIDITGLHELRGIDVREGGIRIGALTTLAELERSAATHRDLEVPAAIAHVMCTPQSRTLATVGGNICNASPAADLAPPLIALGATAALTGARGERTLPLEEIFAGPKATALAADELLTAIVVATPPRRGSGYGRIARTVVDIALALSAVAIGVDGCGAIDSARVALGSVAPVPIRSPSAERLLLGRPLADLDAEVLTEVASAAGHDATPIDDIRTSAAYRRHVIGVLTRRAVADAARRLTIEEDR